MIAESYERIHRANLVGMGVLPLQFQQGEGASALGITGTETFDIDGLSGGLEPRQQVSVTVTRPDGTTFEFTAIARLDSNVDVLYYKNGGILHTVLRSLLN